jgi:hydrogenase-4 component B
LLVGTALFFIGGFLTILVKKQISGIVFMFVAIIAQFLILPPVFKILLGSPMLVTNLNFSGPIGNVFFRIDPLSAFFILIISIGGLFAAVYSSGYMKMYKNDNRYSLGSYYFFMGLLIAAMLLVVMIQNALLFLIAWEIMSLASFFLVSFENQKEEVRRASIYYLVAMQIGAAFLMTAFGWSAIHTNSLDFQSFQALSTSNPNIAGLIFILFFIGFGTKAGFIPFHTWLPLAHPAAPTGVSAIMSGVMIKTGIYGILRMILIIGIPYYWLAFMVLVVALLSGILGVMNAIAQHDLKKLLAYHSIENIGIIGIGIGVGMFGQITGNQIIALAGYLGALLHVFNHFTFKSLLFYGAGVIYTKTHTRNIEKLGGLAHYLPVTTVLFLIGSMAISGIPLFNGFISEFAIYFGLVKGLTISSGALNLTAIIGLAGLAFIGIMAALCFTKVFGICFLGLPREDRHEKPTEASSLFLIPMFSLALLILIIGLFAPVVLPLLQNVVQQFLPFSIQTSWVELYNVYVNISQVLMILSGFILFFIVLRWLLLRRKIINTFKTWDCGYQEGSGRLQYTASSFASSFLEINSALVPHKNNLESSLEMFPKVATFDSHSDDLVDRLLVRPLIALIQRILKLFSWIQSGKTQHYILYGLIFLILLVIWIIGFR